GRATVVTLAVAEVLRGRDVPATVRVRVPGGADASGARIVAGAPAVRAGERVLALLARAPAGWLTPVGLGLGWYRLRGDAARRGDRALGLLGSLDAVGAAMAAWNAVPGANLVLRTAGLASADEAADTSVIRFDDPAGEIPRPRRCAGILALGGYRTAPDDSRR